MHFTLSPLLALAALATPQTPAEPRNVAIVIYPGVELLDFAGPGEVFAAARTSAGGRAFNVYTVAASLAPLVSQGFVHITPEFTYASCPKPDLVVVPGGNVPTASVELREFLLACARDGELVMSVCNGALALGAAGLLDGLEVTTHHGSLEELQVLVPSATVHSNRRFVDHGRVLTSAGVSAGIDGALAVVTRLCGAEAAHATARYMEYAWRPDEIAALHAMPGERVGEAAAEALLAAMRAGGVEAGLALYRKEQAAGKPVPTEAQLNRIGYTLLASRPEEGRATLTLVVELFPASANAHDSLAEALELAGDGQHALAHSRRALELIAQDATLSERLRASLTGACTSRIARLESGAPPGAFACPPCGQPCDARRFEVPGSCPGCGMQLVRVAAPPGSSGGSR